MQAPQNGTSAADLSYIAGSGRGLRSGMQLDGSILDDLDRAVASARRLRRHPVYKDTLTYWAELLQEARRIRLDPGCVQREKLDGLIVSLEEELAERPA
jgi:hypothetical protein